MKDLHSLRVLTQKSQLACLALQAKLNTNLIHCDFLKDHIYESILFKLSLKRTLR